jgi:hypothetical protein
MLYVNNAFSLNMLPDSNAGYIKWVKLSKEEAANILSTNKFKSVVGHEDIAKVISADLGIKIDANRETLKLTTRDELIVAQYIGPRLEPGTTKLPENARIEYFYIKF